MKKVLVIILMATLANSADAGLSFSGPTELSVGETIQIDLLADIGEHIEGFIWIDYPAYVCQISNPTTPYCIIDCGTTITPISNNCSFPFYNGIGVVRVIVPGNIDLLAGFGFTTAPGAQPGDTYALQWLDASFNEVFSTTITVIGPLVELLGPNGSETLIAGSEHSITWSSEGAITDVKLEYSDDNGAGWSVIAASTPNDGQYDWTVPEITSDQCLVRVSDASDAGVNDESDAVFTIYVCLLDIATDIDDNCKVNLWDFAMLAVDWMRNGNPFDPDYSEEPLVMNYQVTECEPEARAMKAREDLRFSVTVEGSYIHFEDMMFANCCPGELFLEMTVENDLIIIWEFEETTGCHCVCDFPITATLGPFEPGTYTFEVYQEEYYGGFIGSTTVTIVSDE